MNSASLNRLKEFLNKEEITYTYRDLMWITNMIRAGDVYIQFSGIEIEVSEGTDGYKFDKYGYEEDYASYDDDYYEEDEVWEIRT